ncbi:MAG: SDR family oxidoreductase [Acidimicrobiia bacterium]|nr:SDR family oxidoreductase [Acidimicrobiia bacterium]
MALDALAPFRLDDKVAVLTGASSGLGARFARVLDGLGASVVMGARRTERLEELAGELRAAATVRCDVGRPGASEELVATAVERFGRLDVAVANAGITATVPALKESVDGFGEVVHIDLVAPFALARAAAQVMKTQPEGGTIVNVASVAAFGSSPLLPQASYVAAKTGLVGLTRELALQWARYPIRVNALCPGMFPSEMTTELVDSDELRAVFETTVPLKRVGRTDELDGALAFLASAASSYMTGQTLVVDGGVALQ